MTNPDEFYDVDDSFPMLMATCVKYMRESLNKRFSDAGISLTAEQWMVMTYLADQDGVSQQDLADRYDRSKASAMHLVRKLEKSGLVIRKPDPIDGRSNRVFLTSEGRKLQKLMIPLAKENMAYKSEG